VTTGAIVLRQPFGGLGKSAFGAGIKAGGPNYVAQLMNFRDRDDANPDPGEALPNADLESLRTALAGLCEADAEARGNVAPADLKRVMRAMVSYAANYDREFGRMHDHFELVGQDNHRRYLPVKAMRVRIHPDDSPFEIFARVCAAKTVGCRVTVSTPPDFSSEAIRLLDRVTESWGGAIEFVEETDEELAEVVRQHQTDRVRYAARGRAPTIVRQAIGDTGIYIADAPVLVEGRIELLWYVMEQSISFDYHRYGNLGGRVDEPRSEVL
jgi:RHH-type proline utilization regulon transcriptional repressor/proline dehydrogenase/delta 1-pyrroline-5-carboxylate dehydrogenase